MHRRLIKQNSQFGFTLIEVILVIAIIGILAVFAMPFYHDVVREAYESQAYGISSEIRAGIVLRFVKSAADPLSPNTYPPHLDAANVAVCDSSNPCFTQVLSQPIQDRSWEKTAIDVYRHVHSGLVCSYNSDSGFSSWGQWICAH